MPAIRGAKSKKKTRRFTRDLDQISADLSSPRHLEIHLSNKGPAEDLPGLGQWYCVECAKHFEGETNFQSHKKGSTHKRRVKALREEPHSQREAEEAVGLGVDNGRGVEKKVPHDILRRRRSTRASAKEEEVKKVQEGEQMVVD